MALGENKGNNSFRNLPATPQKNILFKQVISAIRVIENTLLLKGVPNNSLDGTNPVFRISEKVRFKPAYLATETARNARKLKFRS